MVHLLNLFTGLEHSLFAIHEKKGLDAKVDNMAMATNSSVFCIPGDAPPLKKVDQETTESVIRTVVIPGNIAQLVQDAVVLED